VLFENNTGYRVGYHSFQVSIFIRRAFAAR
jgi:hypothetical protein